MNQKIRVIVLFTTAFLVLNGALALLYILVLAPTEEVPAPRVAVDAEVLQLEQDAEQQAFNDRYFSIHFNEGDAIEVCERETRSRNNNVIQLAVDKLSTRFVKVEDESDYYLVKLNSLVGTPQLYDEKSHECRVDPAIDGVAFYREIMKRRAVRPAR